MKKVMGYDQIELKLWKILVPSIIWQIKERNKYVVDRIALRNGINAGIIINLGVLIESINRGLLSRCLQNEMKEINDHNILQSLCINLVNRIENSMWSEHSDLFKLITERSLKEILMNEPWKNISHLFDFRNALAHGTKLSISNDNTKGELKIQPRKYDKLISFLKERGMLQNMENTSDSIIMKFLSDDVIAFFLKETEKYVEKVADHVNLKDTIFTISLKKLIKFDEV